MLDLCTPTSISHSIDEETGAQKGLESCLRSPSQAVLGLLTEQVV